jgi:hypothetical protein
MDMVTWRRAPVPPTQRLVLLSVLATLVAVAVWIGTAVDSTARGVGEPEQYPTAPTPRLYCDTPTPGPRPTSPAHFPDLVVQGMNVSHMPCVSCSPAGRYWGVLLEVGNLGITESFSCQVDVNGVRRAVPPLLPGEFANVFLPGLLGGDTTAIIDPDGESGEGPGLTHNNVMHAFLPIMTSMPDPGTCTPEPSPAPLPDLVVTGMQISLQPWWECGRDPVLGVHARVENTGAVLAGPFLVSVNGTPRACHALASGESCTVYAAGYAVHEPQEAEADSAQQVAERDETNNVLRTMVAVPTLPPCPSESPGPTATDRDTGTPTATPPDTATPTSSAPAVGAGRLFLPALLRS